MRTRYCCQTKTRKHDNCGGQTGYTVSKVDQIIEAVILNIFRKVQSINREEILQAQNKSDMAIRQDHVNNLQRDHKKALAELQKLQAEIAKSLTGESVFSPEMLKAAIEAQQTKCGDLIDALRIAEADLTSSEESYRVLSGKFNDLLEWASVYQGSDMATKKMVVSHLIDRVDMFRGYEIKITLNISVEQFLNTIEVCV